MVSPQVCFWEGQMFTKKAPKNIDMSQKQIAVKTLIDSSEVKTYIF
jgi:hypothetical protein